MTAAILTEHKSVAKAESARALEAPIPVDHPVSKNN